MKPARRHMIPALILLPALASCALMGKADAPVTMRLAPRFAPPAGAPLPKSVAIAPVQASGATAAQRYTYIDASRPGEVNQAATLFWEEPPPRLLERALVAGLRPRFATVSGPEVSLPADLRVIAELDRFEEVSAPAGSKAVVGFEASVLAGGKVASAGDYCASAAIDGSTPTDRAHAFETALEAAVGSLAQAMAEGGGASTSSSC